MMFVRRSPGVMRALLFWLPRAKDTDGSDPPSFKKQTSPLMRSDGRRA